MRKQGPYWPFEGRPWLALLYIKLHKPPLAGAFIREWKELISIFRRTQRYLVLVLQRRLGGDQVGDVESCRDLPRVRVLQGRQTRFQTSNSGLKVFTFKRKIPVVKDLKTGRMT